jgi:HD-GYP domain-containing protein (c-di-GMP phosphodiesterase class II)
MDGASGAGDRGSRAGHPRPARERGRILDLRDEPGAITVTSHGPELRVAVREGALTRETLVSLEGLWPALWIIPDVERGSTLRLLEEFPPDVVVLPESSDMAEMAAAAREALPSIRVLGAAPREIEPGVSVAWADLSVPADSDPTLWMLAVLGLHAGITGRERSEWVQMVLRAVDSAFRGLTASEADPRQPPSDVVELRRQVERYFEVLLRVILDQAERDVEGFAGRSFRIAELSRQIAGAIRLPGRDVEAARLAGLFHDVGMHLVVSPDALGRAGPLQDAEWTLMRSHPEASVAATAPFGDATVASAISDHHERLDGSGYPRGKRGDDLSVVARIVAVADAYDAMLHPRPHRPSVGREGALEALTADGRAGALDPEIVKVLTDVAGR